MVDREINIQLIIRGCMQDNRSSQHKLYRHFHGYALSIALRYSKNREEAVEILNDAFLKVFNNLDKYDPDYPFKSWLRRIVINSSIDYHRKYYKSMEEMLPLKESYDIKSDEVLPEIFPQDDLLPILQKLPPAYRTVFNLYVMEEYKHHEIAEMLNISVSTSRSNLVRAKEKLRELILKESGRNSPKKNRIWKIF